MKYTGGCHCGAIQFEFEHQFESVIECNCSHCFAKGLLLTFMPATQFKLFSGEDSLSVYQFNKKAIEHMFCKVCGVESFGRGKKPDGTPTVAVNVRSLKDFDINSVKRMPFNGRDI